MIEPYYKDNFASIFHGDMREVLPQLDMKFSACARRENFDMNQRIVIVAGFPRSGTSLMMQMLWTAGMNAAGHWPSFEPNETTPAVGTRYIGEGFVQRYMGGAIKILDPHKTLLPKPYLYDFLWMTRSRNQQARSILKWLRYLGMPIRNDVSELQTMKNGLVADTSKAMAELRSHVGHSLTTVRFEDLIDRTVETVTPIARALGLDVLKMSQCVVERETGSACLPYLLEVKQVDQLENGSIAQLPP